MEAPWLAARPACASAIVAWFNAAYLAIFAEQRDAARLKAAHLLAI